MANSVYDPETRTPKKSKDEQDEFDKVIDRNFSVGDERMMEERAKKSAEEDREAEASAKEADEKRSDGDKGFYSAQPADKLTGKMSSKGGGGIFKRLRKRRKGVLIASGIVGGFILVVLIALLGLLNLFKLDSLMSNIDNRVYSRLLAVGDHRSSKLTSAYIRLRMAEIEDPSLRDTNPERQGNLLYRSTRVDNNKPMTDWYRTMRASKFEERLLEKHGIRFTSVAVKQGTGFVQRTGLITINNQSIPFDLTNAEVRALDSGDTSAFNGRLRNFVEVQVFENNKDARKAIRKAISDETRWWQVTKRRAIRKSIYNMTGVREWRFFENTRDKLQDKRTDLRNRILLKSVPESTKSGKFLRCLFGVNDCKAGDDVANKENQDTTRTTGTERGDNSITENDNNPDTTDTTHTFNRLDILQNILKRANLVGGAVNWVGLIDTLAKVDGNIKSGSISKHISVARGVQAMALYQVFGTARDQIKSNEVTSTEVNPFMQLLGSAGSSEAFVSVVSKNGRQVDSTKMTRAEYCSEENQAKVRDVEKYPTAERQFHYVCDDQRIGSGNNAQKLESSYKNSVGRLVGPIADGYRAATDTPIIGDIIKSLVKVLDFIGESVSQVFFAVAGVLGFADDIEQMMSYVFGKLAAFLGAGPIDAANAAGGVMINWVMQGGAYTAESTARFRGAAALDPVSRQDAVKLAQNYERQTAADMGWYEKFASLSNPNSVLSSSLFSFSESTQSVTGTLAASLNGVGRSISSIILMPFSSTTQADRVNPDAAADFAQIQKYDWPKKCIDLDPLTANQRDGTNIMEVLGNVNEDELTWELMTKSADWYNFVYEKIGDRDNPDEVAKRIWNCHLLDTSGRGGLGFLYGYTDDDGLEEGQQPNEEQQQNTAEVTLTELNGYKLNTEEVKWVAYIKEDVMPKLPGSPDQQADRAARVAWWALKEGILGGTIIPGGNPHRNSNCGTTGQRSSVLEVCTAATWQVGMAGVQVGNFSLEEVENVARTRNPGKTIEEILQSVAILVGHRQGSAEYNQISNATGVLRKSLLMRDPATGFTLVDRNIKPECVDGWKSFCAYDYTGTGKLSGSPGVRQKVVTELTNYFKAQGGLSTVRGLQSPPNLGPEVAQGYYRMPEAPSGEYSFSPNTPLTERCGSKELIDAIYTVSVRWARLYPRNKIIVGDLNAEAGHVSHKKGVDVDITTVGQIAGNTAGNAEASKKLGRLFADTGIIQYIFYNDVNVQRDFNAYVRANSLTGIMQSEVNHHHHFHVRIDPKYELREVSDCPR